MDTLTREAIEAMPAGRAVDALISVRIMQAQIMPANGSEEYWERREDRSWVPMPYYSLRIADAWEVVEALQAQQVFLGIHATADSFSVGDMLTGANIVNAETASLAICRAGLLAILPATPVSPAPAVPASV